MANASGYHIPKYISAGDMSAASVVGAWIHIDRCIAFGLQVTWLGTSSPVGVWGADITLDANPNIVGYVSVLGATALTLSASAVAQNPNGSGVAGSYFFDFSPKPTGAWFRFKYTRTSGGAASALNAGFFGQEL